MYYFPTMCVKNSNDSTSLYSFISANTLSKHAFQLLKLRLLSMFSYVLHVRLDEEWIYGLCIWLKSFQPWHTRTKIYGFAKQDGVHRLGLRDVKAPFAHLDGVQKFDGSS